MMENKAKHIIKGHLHYLAKLHSHSELNRFVDLLVDAYIDNADLSAFELSEVLANRLLSTHTISNFSDDGEEKFRYQFYKAAKELKEIGGGE